jgi:hypothetical protein
MVWGGTRDELANRDHLPTGWLPDDDLTPDARAAQGWAGAMSLPRELFTWEQTDVLRALVTPLSDLPNFERISSPASSTPGAKGNERYIVRTLGMRVAREIEAARGQEVDLLGVRVGPSDAWEVELVGDVAGSDVKEIGIRLSFTHGEFQRSVIHLRLRIASLGSCVARYQSLHVPSFLLGQNTRMIRSTPQAPPK